MALEGDEIIGYCATTIYRLQLDDLAMAMAWGAGRRRYPVPAPCSWLAWRSIGVVSKVRRSSLSCPRADPQVGALTLIPSDAADSAIRVS